MDPVAEIKSRLSIEDVVAGYVSLKKAGRYFKACCPFHPEKTPSFHVNPERQIAYCFGCHKGGDLFQFIQEIEGLDFRGALELLSERANVELPKFDTGQPHVSKDEKDRLKEINLAASNFFVHQLWNTEAGAKVLDYLRKRGLTDETIKHFSVGFAPDSYDLLYRHLLEKKFEKNDILKTTLCMARESTSQDVLDRFRLRLMFPIENDRGEVVAFGGRALKKGEEPKYLNSADYVLYTKGHILYNFAGAKNEIKQSDEALFVEGYFDAAMSWQAVVKNVVATCGTALTEDQLKLVKRYTKRVVFAFDADNAGQEALMRSIKIAQPLNLEIFVVSIPSGKDAADAVKENPEIWRSAVAAKKTYLDFYFEKYKTQFDLSLSQGKKNFTDAMLLLLEGAPHPVERDHYLKEVSLLVGTAVEFLYDLLNLNIANKQRTKRDVKEAAHEIKKSKKERTFEYFLGLILSFPNEYFVVKQKMSDAVFFKTEVEKMGLIKQTGLFQPEKVAEFFNSMENFLSDENFEINASHVYKRLLDYYNLHAALNEGFYESLEKPGELKKLAFEAEVKNQDPKELEQELKKILALLYLEFSNK